MISRRITLFIFSCMFILQTLVNQGVKLSPFQWVMLALSASMVGRATAYLAILEWFRAPFVVTVPHSSGAGEDNLPRWSTGARSAVAELICCPVCSGTWAAGIILALYKYIPEWGEAIMIMLSAASLAWLLTYVTQLVEWKTHAEREQAGLMNRHND